jgi:hypothetical protein
MLTVPDFEDMPQVMNEQDVQYLIVGGLAFIYHVRPRYTKDMDLWIHATPENIERANVALTAFGSPMLMDVDQPKQIVQIGFAPNQIDLIQTLEGVTFDEAWSTRKIAQYGSLDANWISRECLLTIKSAIDSPHHQADAEAIRMLIELENEENA